MTELADAFRGGRVSARQIVDAHIARIDATDGLINAFVHVAREQARERADELDAARARGVDCGQLGGVPFSVKDIIDVAGMPLAAGSNAVRVWPERDAPAVARLLEAGAICLGKANTPEFALWPLTCSQNTGVTRNPLDVNLSPGGSSGGDAAAVAAGMVAFGIGSDFGGSVRWPAHCTGLSSLRPGLGRVNALGQAPGTVVDGLHELDHGSAQEALQVIGPIARSGSDVDAVMRVVVEPARAWVPSSLEGVSVGWAGGEGTVPVDASLVEAAQSAARAIDPHAREVRSEALTEAAGLFTTWRASDPLTSLRAIDRPEHLGATVRSLLAAPRPDVEEGLLSRIAAVREAFVAEMPDLYVMPVASVPAPDLGQEEFVVEGRRLSVWQVLSCSRAISLMGLPAAVGRVGTLPGGRPAGVQVVARPGRDELAVAAISALAS